MVIVRVRGRWGKGVGEAVGPGVSLDFIQGPWKAVEGVKAAIALGNKGSGKTILAVVWTEKG